VGVLLTQVPHLVVGAMALFVSGINEFRKLVKIQVELLSAASSCMDTG
jgi:hypothetical protein